MSAKRDHQGRRVNSRWQLPFLTSFFTLIRLLVANVFAVFLVIAKCNCTSNLADFPRKFNFLADFYIIYINLGPNGFSGGLGVGQLGPILGRWHSRRTGIVTYWV